MCELFGLSCNEKDRATISLPRFSIKGAWCPHGWGIAHYDGIRAVIEKEPKQASRSPNFLAAVQRAKSNIIIAHVRYKTKGEPCMDNCHPFCQSFENRDWVFAHNGCVNGIEHHARSEGTTDSEQVFNVIMDHLQEYQCRNPLNGAYPGIKLAIKKVIDRFGQDIHLNVLMSDGSLLYAFNHYSRTPIYMLKRQKDYGGAILLTTVDKLTDEPWTEIPNDRLIVINRGEILITSNKIESKSIETGDK